MKDNRPNQAEEGKGVVNAESPVTARVLKDDGEIPNSRLPMLIYEGVMALPSEDPARAMEETFERNGWSGTWRDGIYPYHHYHSTAHEVLGVFSGSAEVQLGGKAGLTRTLRAGDVVVLPAGVGHKNVRSSPDFGVVGAYPEGQDWDMNYGRPGERPKTDENIARVPLPTADPVFGEDGPLVQHWNHTGR
jgi:uncharacterized protein YjlB